MVYKTVRITATIGSDDKDPATLDLSIAKASSIGTEKLEAIWLTFLVSAQTGGHVTIKGVK